MSFYFENQSRRWCSISDYRPDPVLHTFWRRPSNRFRRRKTNKIVDGRCLLPSWLCALGGISANRGRLDMKKTAKITFLLIFFFSKSKHICNTLTEVNSPMTFGPRIAANPNYKLIYWSFYIALPANSRRRPSFLLVKE